MHNMGVGRRIISAALGVTAFVSCAVFAGSPGRSAEDDRYYVLSNGMDITILSQPETDERELLVQCGYDPEDYIYEVTQEDGFTAVELYDALKLSVECDGEVNALRVSGGTVGEALEFMGVAIGEEDLVNCQLDSQVYDGMKVIIKRVTYGEDLEDEAIPFETEYRDDPELEKGKEQTVSQGADGTKRLTYKIRYIDGVEAGRELIGEEIISEPENAVIKRGTKVIKKDTSNKSSSSDKKTSGKNDSSAGKSSHTVTVGDGTITTASGQTYEYTKVLSMKATAYSYSAGSKTASGAPVQVGVVAALPSTLPQGTRVYIVTDDGKYTYGPAVVGDTPGGDIIDLFYETEEECDRFGVRQAKVYVLS